MSICWQTQQIINSIIERSQYIFTDDDMLPNLKHLHMFSILYEVELPCNGSPKCQSLAPLRPGARSWWGVEPKARVVIFAETQLNWMVAAFATWCLNGQVPISDEKIWQMTWLFVPAKCNIHMLCWFFALLGWQVVTIYATLGQQ